MDRGTWKNSELVPLSMGQGEETCNMSICLLLVVCDGKKEVDWRKAAPKLFFLIALSVLM